MFYPKQIDIIRQARQTLKKKVENIVDVEGPKLFSDHNSRKLMAKNPKEYKRMKEEEL